MKHGGPWPAIAAVLLFLGCASAARSVDPMGETRARLRLAAGALGASTEPQLDPGLVDYWARADRLAAGYEFKGRRRLGSIEVGPYVLGAALLLPPEGVRTRGSLLVFHGYLSYSLYVAPAFYPLADSGWAVLAVDLPGHGLSTGRPGAIGSFAEYAEAIRGLLSWMDGQKAFDLPRPRAIIGHSAGGAAAMDYLVSDGRGIDGAILLEPLVLPKFHPWTEGFARLLAPILVEVDSGRFSDSYLGVARLPLSWVGELGRWNAAIRKVRPAYQGPLLVLQGAKDDYVDWQSGLRLIRALWPRAEVEIMADTGHIPFDRGRSQGLTLEAIATFLSSID